MSSGATSDPGNPGAESGTGTPAGGDAPRRLPFRDLVPEARERASLLQEFAFRHLPQAVGQLDFLQDPDPDATVLRVFQTFVERRRGAMAVAQGSLPEPADLGATPVEVAGRRAVLVRLPHPEFLPGAYFLLVLPTPALDRPGCFLLERAESPWGREVGMVSSLAPGSWGRRNHGIALIPTAAEFLRGVEEALRRHGEPGAA